MNSEQLHKENKSLRKNIDDSLKIFMTDINDAYQDIWYWINELINNEIKQEGLCNQ